MKEPIIKIEGLGKKYIIGHQAKEKYTALRDVITEKARSLGRKILNPFGLYKKNNIDSGYEEFWALKDVSLEIKRGERIGIIGRNGAGKSTLLKVLSRITEPSEGIITARGRVASLLEVGTGFHPELTGRENIYLNGAILGMNKTEIKKNFDQIVDFAEIEKFLDTPVKRYSSGMYVRLAFAVAAHLEPEILVVDEVLAVGDAQFQKKCLGKMEDISSSEGRTVLFVSHNMAALKSLCNRAYLLDRGLLIFSGGTDETIQKYMYENINNEQENWCLTNSPERVRGMGKNLKITSFDVIDENGDSVKNAICGKKVTFKINFQVFEDKIENLRVSMVFRDLNTKANVTDFNTYYRNCSNYSCETGNYSMAFELKKNQLSPATYILGFIITSGLEVLDWLKDACVFNVIDGIYYEESGQMPQVGHYPIFFSEYDCHLTRENSNAN